MTMESLPTILFQVRGDDVGDLEYIQGFVTSGNYFQVSGDIDGLNDVIDFTVPNGKTAFLIEAKITMSANPVIVMPNVIASNSTNDQTVAELKINTVTKSKAKIGSQAAARNTGGGSSSGTSSGIAPFGESRFNVLGLSLVGNGSDKIEIENVLDNGSAFAEMSGYLIDT